MFLPDTDSLPKLNLILAMTVSVCVIQEQQEQQHRQCLHAKLFMMEQSWVSATSHTQ